MTDTAHFPNGLAELIHPIGEQEFFDSYYGKTPFCTTDRVATEPLLTIEDLIARVQCLELVYHPDYSLAKDGKTLPAMFQRSLEKSSGWIRKLLNEKWTLAINGMYSACFPLHWLAKSLTASLKSEINVNIYYTPSNSQGFDFHCDRHDVFIWQQTGRKAWKVYAQGDREGEGELVIDAVLEPGQVLYIPENCRHAGVAGDGEDSLHLTIGFFSRYSQIKNDLREFLNKWIENDITEGVSDLALPNQMTEGRVGISHEETLRGIDAFRAYVDREMTNGSVVRPIIERIDCPLSPEEVARSLKVMNNDGPFEVIQSMKIEPHPEGGVQLELESGKIVFKEQFSEALNLLSQSTSIQTAELPLESELASAFCRVLVGAGVLKLKQ